MGKKTGLEGRAGMKRARKRRREGEDRDERGEG